MNRAGVLLAVAIALEVAGTLSLRLSEGFTHPGWSAAVALGYVTSIVVFARALARGMVLGVAYATLTGVGLLAAALASAVLFAEGVAPVEAGGLALLLVGVVLLQRPARAPSAPRGTTP